MARALVIGNGHLAVCFDADGVLRDLYYPYIGLENHVGGYKHRVGIWWDGNFSWLDSKDWEVEVSLTERSMLGLILYKHRSSDLVVKIHCVVYNEVPIFLRHLTVINVDKKIQRIKIFFGHEFVISEIKLRNTGFYDPTKNAVIHYKGRRVFLVNGYSSAGGLSEFTVGEFDFAGKVGSYVDAEDGVLSKNAVETGSVDSVIAFAVDCAEMDKVEFYYWLCAGHSIDEVYKLNEEVLEKTPEGIIHSTTAFWQAWAETIHQDFYSLPAEVNKAYYDSLFVLRTHLDHKGGIIASLDSDMLFYGKDSYAYVWPRDAAFVAIALDKAGYHSVTRTFYDFCIKVLHKDGYLHHRFQLDYSLGSTWHSSIKQKEWLKNKILELPIQEDETATVIFGLWEHYLRSNDLEYIESIYKPFIEKAAEFLLEFRDKYTGLPIQSYDLWEEISGVSTYSCSAVCGGLKAAAKFARILGKENHALEYENAVEELVVAMRNYLFDKDLNSFVRGLQVEGVAVNKLKSIDASSLFGLWYYDVLDRNDPMFLGTQEAVENYLHLKTGIGGYIRYQDDNYYRSHNQPEPNPWIVTTLWELQRKISMAHDVDKMRELSHQFNWVTDRLKVYPVMAEQYGPYFGEPLSAAPLAWSHAVFVETVLLYISRMDEMKSIKNSGL